MEAKRQQRQSVQDQDAGAEDRGGDKGGDNTGMALRPVNPDWGLATLAPKNRAVRRRAAGSPSSRAAPRRLRTTS